MAESRYKLWIVEAQALARRYGFAPISRAGLARQKTSSISPRGITVWAAAGFSYQLVALCGGKCFRYDPKDTAHRLKVLPKVEAGQGSNGYGAIHEGVRGGDVGASRCLGGNVDPTKT